MRRRVTRHRAASHRIAAEVAEDKALEADADVAADATGAIGATGVNATCLSSTSE
jgi:nicotinamide mononucleotide (NMN) deamidase PncC